MSQECQVCGAHHEADWRDYTVALINVAIALVFFVVLVGGVVAGVGFAVRAALFDVALLVVSYGLFRYWRLAERNPHGWGRES